MNVLNRIGRYHIQVYQTSQILLLCHYIFKTRTGLPVTRLYRDTGIHAHCDYCVFCHFIAGIPAHQLYILITIVVLWLQPKLLFLYCILYSSFNKVPMRHSALV